MKISIVSTMYYSVSYLKEFHRKIVKTINEITEFDEYEIIFVNDGSPDNSLQASLELLEIDSNIKVIDLSRNFGHHKAIMTGLSYAQGDLVFLIDCDLEEEPELLSEFWREMQDKQDVDVVYGVQEKRKGNWFEQLSGNLFYKLFNCLSATKVPANVITCRLMTKRYVNALVSFKEQEIFLAGLWYTTGFNQVPVYVKKLCTSPTTYNLQRKISIFVNSITAFSNRPLVAIFYLGIFITIVSFFNVAYIILRKIFYGTIIDGWTSIIASVWLIGGIIIFCLGVIGVYLSKIFIETKNRPYTIIKHIYEKESHYAS